MLSLDFFANMIIDRALKRWGDFLNAEINADRLNMRVWTMNMHFTVYHMKDLILENGPLRYYSCRSLERTIKGYSNRVHSLSRPGCDISRL